MPGGHDNDLGEWHPDGVDEEDLNDEGYLDD